MPYTLLGTLVDTQLLVGDNRLKLMIVDTATLVEIIVFAIVQLDAVLFEAHVRIHFPEFFECTNLTLVSIGTQFRASGRGDDLVCIHITDTKSCKALLSLFICITGSFVQRLHYHTAFLYTQANIRASIITSLEISARYFVFVYKIDIQQTTQETPPPPPPPAVQEVEVLNVVEDDVETETIEINTEDDKDVEVVIAPPVEAPVEEEEEEVIFVVVESMPEFPGGQQALFKYLAENVKYPVIAQENGIQGRVICQFVVNKDGSIVDVVAVRSSGEPSLDKEAIRVIQSMPKWKPGKQRGKPVRVKYTVPVNFRLQ